MQPKIVEKLKALLKKWAEGDFKTDPQLNLIPSLYNKLKSEGIDFSVVSETVSQYTPPDNLLIIIWYIGLKKKYYFLKRISHLDQNLHSYL